MQVIKRSGIKEDVSFDKITARIKKLVYGLDPDHINYIEICKKVIQGLYDGVTTQELDNLAAETAASMATQHPDYNILAARISISNFVRFSIYQTTNPRFFKTFFIIGRFGFGFVERQQGYLWYL